ncbi:MAG: hypothetical protein Q8O78_00480 [Candidatus Deferrimicrobium sp.]|nr:hypothetical protein [Candidatus Deferrimicrobium sp.]
MNPTSVDGVLLVTVGKEAGVSALFRIGRFRIVSVYVFLRVIAPAVLSYRLIGYVALTSGIDAIWESFRGMRE